VTARLRCWALASRTWIRPPPPCPCQIRGNGLTDAACYRMTEKHSVATRNMLAFWDRRPDGCGGACHATNDRHHPRSATSVRSSKEGGVKYARPAICLLERDNRFAFWEHGLQSGRPDLMDIRLPPEDQPVHFMRLEERGDTDLTIRERNRHASRLASAENAITVSRKPCRRIRIWSRRKGTRHCCTLTVPASGCGALRRGASQWILPVGQVRDDRAGYAH
jgi:hypothetical protein